MTQTMTDVKTLKISINGEWRESTTDKYMPVTDSSTGRVIANAPQATKAEVEEAIGSAHEAFLTWSQLSIQKRIQVIYRWRGLLEDHMEELAVICSKELGKNLDEARGEIIKIIEACETAMATPMLMKGESLMNVAAGHDTVSYREPLGVFAGIAPFNFPAMIPFGWMVPLCIATGNTIVIKAASLVPMKSLIAGGELFKNMDNGQPLEPYLDRVKTANVYIGAEPIVEALQQGADIVITGRATDPSIVLAPMMYEFGWSMKDMNLLAAGTIAGHIVECGAQCTGGNYVHWKEIPDMARIGYPVIEAHPDGTFAVTKHAGTGGRVSVETVTSQLVYEMSDPANYITPDCVADFTSIQLKQDGPDRVAVSGIKGRLATDTYKVSISFHEGYKIISQLTVAGPDAVEKAKLCADIVFERVAMDGVTFTDDEKFIEILGTNACHAGIVPAPENPAEVVLRIGARSNDKAKLDRLGMEIVPLVTSGPPGVTGFAGGRPKATEIISYWPALLSKGKIKTKVSVEEVTI